MTTWLPMAFCCLVLSSCGGPPERPTTIAHDSVSMDVSLPLGASGISFRCDVAIDAPNRDSMRGHMYWSSAIFPDVIPFEIEGTIELDGGASQQIEGRRGGDGFGGAYVSVTRMLDDLVCAAACTAELRFTVKGSDATPTAPVDLDGTFRIQIEALAEYGVDSGFASVDVTCDPPEILSGP